MAVTVKVLIEALSKFDDDAAVYVYPDYFENYACHEIDIRHICKDSDGDIVIETHKITEY